MKSSVNMNKTKATIVANLRELVGPQNVLTDIEDLYVYSFEHFFKKRRYSKLDLIVRINSDKQIEQVIELARKERFTVIRRSDGKINIFGSIRAPIVLLDDAVPPKLEIPMKAQGKGQTVELVDEIHRAGHGTSRNYALALKSLFRGLPARQCLDCTVCSGYCTVTSSFNDVETWSSKGRALLMRGLSTGELQPSLKLIDVLYTCSLCGLCFAQCFHDTQVRKAIIDVRRKIAEKSLTPETFTESAKNIFKVGDPSGMPISRRISWMKELSKSSFPQTANVLYWVGCVVATRTPKVAKAVANVLKRARVEFTVRGEREGCCGYILLASGLWKEAEENAVKLAERVKQSGAEILVTSCAGCYYTFKRMYPEMLGVELPCEILHATQLVERQIRDSQIQPGNLSMKVTYHDPCSLGRHSNVYDPPRNVLKSVPSLELVEMSLNRNRARCCGAGGGLWSFNNRVASESAYKRLVNDVVPLGVDVIATACPTCHINLHFASVKKSLGVRVCDVMELVERATS